MNTCKFEHLLPDYLDGDLSQDEARDVTRHLEECASCRRQQALFQDMGNALRALDRPEPHPDLVLKYDSFLRKRFSAPKVSPIQSLWEKILTLGDFSSPAFRLAGAVALVLFGILIGRVTWRSSAVPGSEPTAQVLLVAVSPQDRVMLTHFLTESEMLLLGIVNSDNTHELDRQFTRQTAHQLLTQSTLVESPIRQINNEGFSLFVNRLESLLLELSNAGDRDFDTAMTDIKKMIQETHLHHEPQRWQGILESI